MAFGTFDIVHAGHRNFFTQARKLSKNPYLIVSVARDANVIRIKKSKPLYNESKRLDMVAAEELVDKAVLGDIRNYRNHIKKEQPDLIVLGYDQEAYTVDLSNELAKIGLTVPIVRLRPYRQATYKSSILKRKLKKVV